MATVSASGGAGGSGGGDHHGNSNPNRDKKRYHRHTPEQIQILEAVFEDCHHPDEKTRSRLSRDLGLDPKQIKFWFQNRRTQMKAKNHVDDNFVLRAENDKLRRENIAMRETLDNATCDACGGGLPDDVLDEQKIRYENAKLKEELERVSSIVMKHIGRSLSQIPHPDVIQPLHPNNSSSLDLLMGPYVGDTNPSMTTVASDDRLLNLGLITPTPSNLPTSHPLHLTSIDKSIIADMATNAMDVLIKLLHTNEPLWTKSGADERDVLDINSYERLFPSPNTSMRNSNLWIEASRATGDVMMNSMQLVDMFIDSTKWSNLFSTIVSNVKTIEVISTGFNGNQDGSLHLMYEEMQVASPLVPVRPFVFIRFCKQIDQDSWALVDVSYDFPNGNNFQLAEFMCRRLPSGCLIQRLPNGSSKVMWVEHVVVEEKMAVHRLFRDLIYSGLAFGAERWVACLERSCERVACQMTNAPTQEHGGVNPSTVGKNNVMKLAQRMVKNFCASIPPRNKNLWSSVSDFDDFEIHATIYKSEDPTQPNAMVVAAAATVWLPLSPQIVFDFLQNKNNRHQWDVLSNHSPVQQVMQIANGSHPGNSICILRDTTLTMLQESFTDSSESLVVYCPVDLSTIDLAMRGQDPDSILLLPSGFAITTDGRHSGTAVSLSRNLSGGGAALTGSLVTVVLQVGVNSMPSAQVGEQAVANINNLIGSTVRRVKACMNCSSTTT